jgi:hypothetical protein
MTAGRRARVARVDRAGHVDRGAIVRAVVSIALGVAVVRAVGTTVGTWAAGALDVPTTLFVGVLAPAWILVFLPTWLGWRLVGPRRAPRLVGTLCWLSPLVRARELPSVRVFLEIAAGRAFPAPGEIRADAWTALAAALQAERQGNAARAGQILDALAYLPQGSPFSWLARVWGVEMVVAAAIDRGDWTAAARYTALGRGRLARFLALLAEAQAGRIVSRAELWWRWALAPGRLRNRRLVEEILARQAAPAGVTPAPAAGCPVAAGDDAAPVAGDVRLRHLVALDAAARDGRFPLREVFTLAAAWEEELGEPSLARLRARALELDARGGAEQARSVRETVLEELATLAETAEGVFPAAVAPGSLAGELGNRLRDKLFRRVEEALAALGGAGGGGGSGGGGSGGDGAEPAAHPLGAWERWLALRAALERVEEHAGPVALTTLWYGGVRNAVWNWTCTLFNADRARTAWVAHAMFSWVADRAELLGDVATMITNRENARVALAAA